MYFFLSKFLLCLIFPITWICVLLIIALITKSSTRRFRLVLLALLLLYIFSSPPLLNLFAGAWNVKNEVPDNHTKYSCVIILGGFSGVDGSGQAYFTESAARFIGGETLYSTGRVSHIMVTGGNTESVQKMYKEGKWAKQQFELLNYPDSVILMEDKSLNTLENAEFSKPILQKSGLKPPYLLLTSDFHMRRARMIFKHMGYNVLAYPVYTNGNNRFKFSMLLPDATTLLWWNVYIKEMVGYVVNYYKH